MEKKKKRQTKKRASELRQRDGQGIASFGASSMCVKEHMN